MGQNSGLKLRKKNRSLKYEQKKCELLHMGLRPPLPTYKRRENRLEPFHMRSTQGLVVGTPRLSTLGCDGEVNGQVDYPGQGSHDPSPFRT